jgi:hypothetical protein
VGAVLNQCEVRQGERRSVVAPARGRQLSRGKLVIYLVFSAPGWTSATVDLNAESDLLSLSENPSPRPFSLSERAKGLGFRIGLLRRAISPARTVWPSHRTAITIHTARRETDQSRPACRWFCPSLAGLAAPLQIVERTGVVGAGAAVGRHHAGCGSVFRVPYGHRHPARRGKSSASILGWTERLRVQSD